MPIGIRMAPDGGSLYVEGVPVLNGPPSTIVRHQLVDLRTSASGGEPRYCLRDCHFVDARGINAPIILSQGSDSAWEYAEWIASVTGPEGTQAANTYGNAHGHEVGVSFSIAVNGRSVPLGSVSTSSPTLGDVVVFTSRRVGLFPTNSSIHFGEILVTHTFGARGLDVTHSHDYAAGYRIVDTSWCAMLPSNGKSFNRCKIGQAAAFPLVGDDAFKPTPQPTPFSTFGTLYSTLHPYGMMLRLPSGEPRDDGVGWTQDTALQFTCHDRAEGGKLYIPCVSLVYGGGPRDWVPATSGRSTTANYLPFYT